MTGPQLQTALLLAVVALVGIVGLVVVLPRPRLAFAALLCCLAFTPSWLLGNILPIFSLHVLTALVCLASLILASLRGPTADGPGGFPRWNGFDVAIVVVLVLAGIGVALGQVETDTLYDTAVWLVMYLTGRFAVRHLGLTTICTMVAVVFAIVAAFAVVEFVTGTNLWLKYTANSTAAFRVWGTQQYRGDRVRVEAAFGHSIALGTSLAIAAILTTAARLRSGIKIALIVLMSLAILLTYSRTAFVTLGVGMLLVILRSDASISRSMRLWLGAVGAASIPLAVLATSDAFTESGAVSSNAALYRLWLWDLLPGIKAFGSSDLFQRTTDGTVTIGSFGSIDSAVLLHALSAGWIATGIILVSLAVAAVRLLVRAGDVALIALVALIPSFFTVALIEQYSHLAWLVAGMAVTGLAATRAAASRADLARPETSEPLGAMA